jgi:uncharacterized membrane protein
MVVLKEKSIHEVFIVSLVLKAANAALQIGSGTLLLISGKMTSFIESVVNNELVKDPNDFLASHTAALLTHIASGSQYFAAWYLLSHGIIKAALVVALMKNKLWAYPVSIYSLIAFILYQCVRWTHTHSIFLVLLTIFDIFLIWLIAHEYRYILKHRHVA